VHSAVLRSHVCMSVCDVGNQDQPHTLETLETNCTDNYY